MLILLEDALIALPNWGYLTSETQCHSVCTAVSHRRVAVVRGANGVPQAHVSDQSEQHLHPVRAAAPGQRRPALHTHLHRTAFGAVQVCPERKCRGVRVRIPLRSGRSEEHTSELQSPTNLV